ncbi:helix-turn-helix domain-containing protein [Methylococcus sp. Mc7]|uniref:helix-turn-helix domain-containing protein n=1 Tax=Methylococcus sp. Mc7 TaxID=2860258 RepID=UPI0021080308|nr:helix-turn-helix domain-containing protein [Methylococcus sp. Mc7]
MRWLPSGGGAPRPPVADGSGPGAVRHASCHTHLSLAYRLGVRSVGITKAANSLQKQELISYRRGDVTILDRVGLESASCGCYRAGKEIYERILG